MIYVRSLIFSVLFFTTLGLFCVIGSLLFFMPEKWHVKMWNNIPMPFLRWALKIVCGLDIEVRGKRNISQNGVIYASKHQSAMETYVLTTIIKKGAFILKKELTYIPVFGWAQALYGMINVNRASGGAAMRNLLREARKALAKKRPIIIFPEGTRTKAGTKTEYKSGIYFLVENLKVPVIPVALNTGLFWKKNSFLRHKGKVVIEFLPQMPDNLSKQEFMSELESRIEAKCQEINAEAIAKYPDALKIYNENVGKKDA